MAESIDSLVSRPVIVQPSPVEQGQLPGQESPAPTEAEARAAAALFAQENSEKPPSLLGFAAAGMLVHDIVQDALARNAEEDDEDERAQPKPEEA